MDFINFLTKCYLFLFRTSVLTSILSFPHPFALLCTLRSWLAPSAFPFSLRRTWRLGLSFGIVVYFHHIPGLFLSPWAGLPVPRPDIIFQLKRGDEPWIVDLHGSEERECPENVSLGNCVWTGQGRAEFCFVVVIWGCRKEAWVPGFSHIHIFCFRVYSLSPTAFIFFSTPESVTHLYPPNVIILSDLSRCPFTLWYSCCPPSPPLTIFS